MGDTERELEAKIERDEATRLKALGDRGCMLELLEFAVDFFEQAGTTTASCTGRTPYPTLSSSST